MLKVLHTGDWHIGSFPGPEVGGQNARFQDICRCLDFQAMYAEEHRPDLIVVSGDIFHQARVWSDRGLRESRTAIDHIRRLSNLAPTVVLRGTPNHDSEEQFEMLTTAFYGDDSVSVVTEPEVLHIHTYHGQRVDVACIPGFDRGVSTLEITSRKEVRDLGRSNRQTADYFPHYVGEKSRTKFILEKNWGNDGYAFWFKLLELLCAADGQYYDCWDKMGWEYLLAVTGVICTE